MLVVARRAGEKILIGDDIAITIVKVFEGGLVRVGIDAPLDKIILRDELKDRPRKPPEGEREATDSH